MGMLVKIKIIPLIVSIFLFMLYSEYAYSAGTPVVNPGTDPTATHLGEVNYREFSSGGNEEVFLGVPDLNLGGAYRTEMNLTWNATNTITFSYDPVLDELTTTVDNGSEIWSLEYVEFSNNVRDLAYGGDQEAADYALNHLNYLQINVTLREKPTAQLNLDDAQLDGIPLGNFPGVYHGTESWYVAGYDFSDGFNFTGVVNLSGISNPSPEKNTVEIILGSIDVYEPEISNVLTTPDLVAPGAEVTLTATATDSGTNNIQSVEFNIEAGPWNPMDAQDGTYDSPVEDIFAIFSAPSDHGVFNVCVRATNALNNISPEECTVLSVDGQGPVALNLQATPGAVTSGEKVALTATVDDAATGGSNLQSAEFNLGGGPWQHMKPQDGYYDSPSEVVEATFVVSNQSGDYALCLRGKDVFVNVGSETCIQLVVSEAPEEPEGPVEIYLPCIIKQAQEGS